MSQRSRNEETSPEAQQAAEILMQLYENRTFADSSPEAADPVASSAAADDDLAVPTNEDQRRAATEEEDVSMSISSGSLPPSPVAPTGAGTSQPQTTAINLDDLLDPPDVQAILEYAITPVTLTDAHRSLIEEVLTAMGGPGTDMRLVLAYIENSDWDVASAIEQYNQDLIARAQPPPPPPGRQPPWHRIQANYIANRYAAQPWSEIEWRQIEASYATAFANLILPGDVTPRRLLTSQAIHSWMTRTHINTTENRSRMPNDIRHRDARRVIVRGRNEAALAIEERLQQDGEEAEEASTTHDG